MTWIASLQDGYFTKRIQQIEKLKGELRPCGFLQNCEGGECFEYLSESRTLELVWLFPHVYILSCQNSVLLL